MRSGRLPWPVSELIPDPGEQHGQAGLDAQDGGAHGPISADRCQDDDMEAVNIGSMLARFSEHWAPKKIAELNDYDVKIVKVLGEFTWHRLFFQAEDGIRDHCVTGVQTCALPI